jgi:hypothetical protein
MIVNPNSKLITPYGYKAYYAIMGKHYMDLFIHIEKRPNGANDDMKIPSVSASQGIFG